MALIILAAVLLELISAVQYHYSRKMIEDELEHRAENELRLKAVLIKGMLNATEKTMRSYSGMVQEDLGNVDELFKTLTPLVTQNADIENSGFAYVPNYFPHRERLVELVAMSNDEGGIIKHMPGQDHDYTQMDFYSKVVESGLPQWSDPYIDDRDTVLLVTSYSMPIYDNLGCLAGVFAADVSIDWLSDTLNARHMYPSSFDLLLTEAGDLICHPSEDHGKSHDVQQVVNMINDSTIARVKSKNGRTTIIDFCSAADGRKGYVYYANMKGKPHWQLAVVCYDEEVYGGLGKIRLIVLLSMLAALTILGGIVSLFARNERRLHHASIKQERIASELHIASALQSSMLPGKDESIISRTDIDVAGSLLPAVEVGGDLYDYFIRDEKLFFCIGDVSGKGVPSSLVMAVVHVVFYTTAAHESNPSRIMQALNQAVCRNNNENMFVTFFVGVLDLPTGRLRYCNAGHDVPVVIDGMTSLLPVKANLPIGVMDDAKFETQETLLAPGTSLFLYTDGLTEAMNKQHDQMGQQRVLDTLEQCRRADCSSPDGLLAAINDAVRQFVEDAPQSDDLTLLALRFTPAVEKDILDEALELTNDVKQVKDLNRFVEDVCSRLQVAPAVEQQVKLAVEEAVVNVMSYAYPLGTTGRITVNALSDGDVLKIAITDEGKRFDPTEAARVDTTLSVEERSIGGLGIHLVRQLMDSINYERIDGKNILTLRKNIK